MLANGGWDLTLILLTWTIWRAPTNASKWRMGFNSAFKGLRGTLLINLKSTGERWRWRRLVLRKHSYVPTKQQGVTAQWSRSLKPLASTILRLGWITPYHNYTCVAAYWGTRVKALGCTNTGSVGSVRELRSCATKPWSGRNGKLLRRNQYKSKAGH